MQIYGFLSLASLPTLDFPWPIVHYQPYVVLATLSTPCSSVTSGISLLTHATASLSQRITSPARNGMTYHIAVLNDQTDYTVAMHCHAVFGMLCCAVCMEVLLSLAAFRLHVLSQPSCLLACHAQVFDTAC